MAFHVVVTMVVAVVKASGCSDWDGFRGNSCSDFLFNLEKFAVVVVVVDITCCTRCGHCLCRLPGKPCPDGYPCFRMSCSIKTYHLKTIQILSVDSSDTMTVLLRFLASRLSSSTMLANTCKRSEVIEHQKQLPRRNSTFLIRSSAISIFVLRVTQMVSRLIICCITVNSLPNIIIAPYALCFSR